MTDSIRPDHLNIGTPRPAGLPAIPPVMMPGWRGWLRRLSARRGQAIAICVAVLVVLVPVGVVVAVVAKGAVDANAAGTDPPSAAFLLVQSFDAYAGRDKELGFVHLFCKKNEKRLASQRDLIIDELYAIEKAHEYDIDLELKPDAEEEVVYRGSARATVGFYVSAFVRLTDQHGSRHFRTPPERWEIDVQKESNGWVVCAMRVPRICGDYFTRDACA
ncbi:hypothetical protein Val02_62910 [Virgisporangium aliadipatigenens]|uniref:Uncharacterized protein n=1 Tax=Virgisporangium aliadipatigenens TaxID=741659 RepID=A0A8J4DSM8_9ACTN|nr:hypothetical protein [Virgisporangium aliadipatigenens]GIJ49405.1 hypothetical protein Val02_62910 [Virgisporangium aliadipatigenens]